MGDSPKQQNPHCMPIVRRKRTPVPAAEAAVTPTPAAPPEAPTQPAPEVTTTPAPSTPVTTDKVIASAPGITVVDAGTLPFAPQPDQTYNVWPPAAAPTSKGEAAAGTSGVPLVPGVQVVAHHTTPPTPAMRFEQHKEQRSTIRTENPVRDVQRLLSVMPNIEVKADGKMNAHTRAAIDRFVERHNQRVEMGDPAVRSLSKLTPDSSVDDLLRTARTHVIERVREGKIAAEDTPSKGRYASIQRGLNALGYPVDTDGSWGKESQNAYQHLITRADKGDLQPPIIKAPHSENSIRTGLRYVGRTAPTSYPDKSSLGDFDIPPSAAQHANEDGWISYQISHDWGQNAKGGSRWAGEIGFARFDKHGKVIDRRPYAGVGGGADNVRSAHEWQNDGSTPGAAEVDHVRGDQNVTAIMPFASIDYGHRWGVFALLDDPYKHRDAIGIHPNRGGIGSHGCPNPKDEDKKDYERDLRDVAKGKSKPDLNHVVFSPELRHMGDLSRQRDWSRVKIEDLQSNKLAHLGITSPAAAAAPAQPYPSPKGTKREDPYSEALGDESTRAPGSDSAPKRTPQSKKKKKRRHSEAEGEHPTFAALDAPTHEAIAEAGAGLRMAFAQIDQVQVAIDSAAVAEASASRAPVDLSTLTLAGLDLSAVIRPQRADEPETPPAVPAPMVAENTQRTARESANAIG